MTSKLHGALHHSPFSLHLSRPIPPTLFYALSLSSLYIPLYFVPCNLSGARAFCAKLRRR